MTTSASAYKSNVVVLPVARPKAQQDAVRFNPQSISRAVAPLLKKPGPFLRRVADVSGLALRRQSTNRLTFIVEKRHNHRLYRVVVGVWDSRMTAAEVEDIKVKARITINQIVTGNYRPDAAEVSERANKLRAMTIAEVVETYAVKTKPAIRAKTVEGYKLAAQRVARAGGLATKPLSQWTPDDVREAHGVLVGEVKESTASGYMRSLRAVVEGWRHWFPEAMVPAANVISTGMRAGNRKRWVTAKPRPTSLKARELLPFLQAASTLAAQANDKHTGVFRFCELLLLTGMRFTEVAALTWAEVDLEHGTLTLGAHRMKAKSEFIKPLGKRAVGLLRAQHAISGGGTYVFPSPSKPGMHIDDDRYAMGRIIAMAGCTRVTPHDLRRSFLRAAEAAGLPASYIKALVHHTTRGDVTSDYIGGGFEDNAATAAQRVEDFMLEGRA